MRFLSLLSLIREQYKVIRMSPVYFKGGVPTQKLSDKPDTSNSILCVVSLGAAALYICQAKFKNIAVLLECYVYSAVILFTHRIVKVRAAEMYSFLLPATSASLQRSILMSARRVPPPYLRVVGRLLDDLRGHPEGRTNKSVAFDLGVG